MDMMSKQIMTHINLARHMTAGVGCEETKNTFYLQNTSQPIWDVQDWNTMTCNDNDSLLLIIVLKQTESG